MKTMHCRAFVLAFNFVLFRSEAFVVSTRKARAIGNHPPFIFEIFVKSFNEERDSRLYEKSRQQRTEAQPQSSPLLRQVESALAPAADFLDNFSDGWALTYADLTPNRCVTLLQFS